MTWFPDRRKGTPEQVRAYDAAFRALSENAEDEKHRGVRTETHTFLRLNHQVNELRKPLSGWQRGMTASFHRLNRQYSKENRAVRQEHKQARRAADPARTGRVPRRRSASPARPERSARQGRVAR
jgi:hypothetical protein